MQKRIDIVKRMQQILYDESPYIVLVYPLDLEPPTRASGPAGSRARRTKGAWWYNTQPDSYVSVHPAGRPRRRSSGGSSTGIIVGVVVAVIVVVIVVLLLRRRGGRRELEG